MTRHEGEISRLDHGLSSKAERSELAAGLREKANAKDTAAALEDRPIRKEVEEHLGAKAEKTEVQALSRQLDESQGRATFNVDRFWVFLAALLVFFMQAGFKCLEVGMIDSRFGVLQAAQKLFGWVIAFVGFCVAGFGLMFAATHSGFIGKLSPDPASVIALANAKVVGIQGLFEGTQVRGLEFLLFQAAFAATAVTIPTGATAERLGLKGYIVIALIIAIWIYPVFGHWAWGGGIYAYTDHVHPELDDLVIKRQPEVQGWLQALGFHDFAGSTVVHSIGGWCALWLAVALRPRKVASVPPLEARGSSRGYAFLGVFMLWFGWWGFNGGSKLSFEPKIATIILNTNLAGAAAGISAYLLACVTERLSAKALPKGFLPEKVVGGVLGGLVAITASCDIASPPASFVVGLIAGAVHNIVFDLLLVLKVDDPVGAVPVHAGCGILGTLLVAFVGPGDAAGEQLLVQGLGVLVAAVWSSLMILPLCLALREIKALGEPETDWLPRTPLASTREHAPPPLAAAPVTQTGVASKPEEFDELQLLLEQELRRLGQLR